MQPNENICRPVRVLQFGEGNFLRAFVDSIIDEGNRRGILNTDIAIVKPRDGHSLQTFHDQKCRYTVAIRGLENGNPVQTEQLVTSVSCAINPYRETEKYRALYLSKDLRFIISNTTEAGITFDPEDSFQFPVPKSYPGKLTKLLYERYTFYNGAPEAGLHIIPCELIEDNGAALKFCVLRYAQLWDLDKAFISWLEENCFFAGTLVDRIVSGFPKANAQTFFDKIGYEDQLLVVAEPYHLWAIEADPRLRQELPLDKVTSGVVFTEDVRPYRQRKVRILNGSHTLLTPVALLLEKDFVRRCMQDETLSAYLEKAVKEEIIPYMDCLPQADLLRFYNSVVDRFANPDLDHSLVSISLNSVSKYHARLMPSVFAYHSATGKVPKLLTFSFAALLAYMRSGAPIQDSESIVAFFADAASLSAAELVDAVFEKGMFPDELRKLTSFRQTAVQYLTDILTHGTRTVLTSLLEGQE